MDDVYFQVGSSATLGTGTAFEGNIVAEVSDTLTTGASVNGRVIALTGAVTLDTNAITSPSAVPEPASLGWFGAGIAIMLVSRKSARACSTT